MRTINSRLIPNNTNTEDKPLFHLSCFLLLYYLAVVIGLEARIDNIALIWPANGVAFCYFILRPVKEWLYYILALSVGYVAGMYVTGDYPWSIILGVLIANILQTLSGAWLVKRYAVFPISLGSSRQIILVLFSTALIGSSVSALFTLMMLGKGFMETPWQLWVSGIIDNAGSTMVTLPLILLLTKSIPWPKWQGLSWQRFFEIAALVITTCLLTEYVFTTHLNADVLMRTLPYLLFPCVLWAALRYGQYGAILSISFICSELIRHTIQGEGPFATNDSGFTLVLTVHMYMGTMSIMGLIIGALIKQQTVALQALAGSIAHEMRNPLNSIRLSLNSIRNHLQATVLTPATPNHSLLFDALDTANHSIDRSMQVIDLTLDSIHEKNIDPATFEFLSARHCVEQAVKEYGYRYETERKKVKIIIKQDFIFKGDETLLVYVLFNLLKNALYYLSDQEQGIVSITIQAVQNGHQILVRDNGPGIAPSAMPHLFESYFTSGKEEGTGLGLAYCKRVMQAFSGGIQCFSTEGEFTEFVLKFPVVDQTRISQLQALQLEEVLTYLQTKQILIVDDDTILIEQLLNQTPHKLLNIDLVDDAQHAVLQMRQQHYDLVVMDLNLPGVDGYKAIHWIRERKLFADDVCLNSATLPIMVFSNEVDAEKQRKALITGATAFVAKTSNSIEFFLAMKACIEQAKRQALTKHTEPNLKGRCILFVDDEVINHKYYHLMFKSLGIKSLQAASAETALTILETQPCDMVITDLHMPGTNGFQLAALIRQGKHFHNFQNYSSIPIVAISGDPRPEIEKQCLDVGMYALLEKPLNDADLLQTLVSALQLQQPHVHNFSGQQHYLPRAVTLNAVEREKLAKFLHDIVKPTMALGFVVDILKQYLPHLLTKVTILSPVAIDSLSVLTEGLIQANNSGLQKQRILRRHFEDHEVAPDKMSTIQLISDIQLCWQWIATLHQNSLSIYFPVLLQRELFEAEINDETWLQLIGLVDRSAQICNQARQIIKDCEGLQ